MGSVIEKVVECECGWSYRGREEEIVAATQRHVREEHQMEATREQILAMARPADESGSN